MGTIPYFPPPPPDTQGQSQWNRACALAAQGFSEEAEPARLAKGLALAQAHHVCITDEDEPDTYADVASGKTVYAITHDKTCPCKDYEAGQLSCKHLLALAIHEQALRTVHEQPITIDLEPKELSVPPSITSIAQTIENPAGANFKARVGNAELWYTWHGANDNEVLARMRETLPQLQEIVSACEEAHAIRESDAKALAIHLAAQRVQEKAAADLPTLLAQAVKDAMAAQQSNGSPTPSAPAGTGNMSFCKLHNTHMQERTNAAGNWWSHQLNEVGPTGKPVYCRGK